MAPKPNSARKNATLAHAPVSASAHGRERVVAAAALQHAEAQQDRDGADMRDQQVQEAGAADLGNPVSVVTRKYDDSAIDSHATMNR